MSLDENVILKWIEKEASTNSIRGVTDVVLGGLIQKFDHIAVLFYSHKNKAASNKLETIADDCADNDIAIVKIDDKEEAGQYGLDKIPTLMFFNQQVNIIIIIGWPFTPQGKVSLYFTDIEKLDHGNISDTNQILFVNNIYVLPIIFISACTMSH